MFNQLRKRTKVTAGIVLISVIVLMMVAAYLSGKLLSDDEYTFRSKIGIMAAAKEAYLKSNQKNEGRSYRVGRNIINISYQTNL